MGRYELCFEIAVGGMATVYLARTSAIGGFRKIVALKVIHPHLSRDTHFIDMFLDEARLVAQLHHPNVATVTDVGEADGTYFMAMEHVLGESVSGIMRALARDGAMPAELPIVAAKIVADACEGLHAAHELRGPDGRPLGVVHRDVSPQNVLVGFDGTVRVIDFGVAKAAGKLSRTRTGMVKGKFAYMAPEQLAGGPIDRRADVWSLGVVLWEMATGRRLFRGSTEGETVLAVQTRDVRAPSSVEPTVPPAIDDICARALAREPGQRYETARDMARDLRRFMVAETGDLPGLEELAGFMDRACGEVRREREALVERARTMETVSDPAAFTLSRPPDPPRAPPAVETNLLPDASSLVGREADRVAVRAAIAAGARIVTLVGPPGIGKTRLAVRCAEERLSNGEGHVWLVDLTEARTDEDVCAQVFEAVGVRPPAAAGADEMLEYLGRALAQRSDPWLLLDNFEQIVDLAPRTVERWARIATRATFLVTSRETLRVPGEHVIELSPLAIDGSGSPAVQLLVERASGYRPSDGDEPILEEIARALEGIPLALELAATRLAVLGPRKLLERMPDTLALLSRGRRGATDRHATLRSAIDWSWSLLEPWEREALAQCSVFRGGFFAEDAEAVLCCSDPDAPSAIDVLSALRDKSLLRAQPLADLPGELRLRPYEAVREYARGRLEAQGDAAEVACRHAERFAAVGERWAEEVQGPRGIEALGRLAHERDNLLAAAEHALAGDDGGLALRLVRVLDVLLSRRGPFDRQLALLDRAVALETIVEAGVLSAEIRLARARALRQRGRMPESLADLDAALAGHPDDDAFAARVELERAEVHQAQGRLDQARACLDRALERAGEGESITRGRIEESIGLLHHSQGRLDEAWEAYARAHRVFRARGDVTAEASVLHYFGSLRLQQGRLDEARACYERALELERRIGHTRIVGSILGNLGILEQEVGNLSRARERYEDALRSVREVEDRTLEGHLLGYLAGLALERGELAEAERSYEEAIGVLRDVGDKRLEGLFLAASGAVQAGLGREAAARERFAAAEALLDDLGDPGLLGALAIHRGHLFLLAHASLRESDPRGAGEAWARAEGLLAGDRALASDDFRFARRVLRAALERGALTVASDASWLVLPDGERVDLSARLPLRRIVARILDARRESPGVPVSVDDLVAAGWPDERILPSAAGNRVHVALTSLRKLGLRGLLVREGDGYLLDPGVPLVRRDGPLL